MTHLLVTSRPLKSKVGEEEGTAEVLRNQPKFSLLLASAVATRERGVNGLVKFADI